MAIIKIGDSMFDGNVTEFSFEPSLPTETFDAPVDLEPREVSFSFEVELTENGFREFDNAFDLTPALKP